MSQVIFTDINPATTSGTQLATLLNNFKAAILSGFSGTTRPTLLQAGGYWIDTTQEGSPNFKVFYKYYTGTTDIIVFTINLATGVASFASTEDLYRITKTSADTASPILDFLKKRIANAGQVLANDIVGTIQFSGTDNTGANPIAARIRAIAVDAMTPSASGTCLVIETTKTGEAALSESLRAINGRIGIGVTDPSHDLHVRGLLGARVERLSDNALPVIANYKKGRVAGNGGVLLNDILFEKQVEAIDSTGASTVVFKETYTASENHSATVKGVQRSTFINKPGEAVLTEKTRQLGELTEHYGTQKFFALDLDLESVATAATIAALNSNKTIVNLTGAIDTIIQGLNVLHLSKVVLVHNGSTARVTLAHQNVSASATNRMILPKNKDIVLVPNQSVELFYSTVESRWKLKSGSGGGGGELTVLTSVSIVDGGTITLSAVDARQVIKVAASGTTGILSTTPFGSFVSVDPVEVILLGDDNTATLFLPFNDATFGCVGNFESEGSIEISKNLPVKAVWLPATQRFYVSRGV